MERANAINMPAKWHEIWQCKKYAKGDEWGYGGVSREVSVTHTNFFPAFPSYPISRTAQSLPTHSPRSTAQGYLSDQAYEVPNPSQVIENRSHLEGRNLE
jgi:hypothetical protein